MRRVQWPIASRAADIASNINEVCYQMIVTMMNNSSTGTLVQVLYYGEIEY